MTSKPQISEFWRWFQSVSGQFGERFENGGLIDELDRRIGSLGHFSWEVGPGLQSDRNNALAITPSGDLDLLSQTRAIIAVAPTCSGWEFYPAKPPKRWLRTFTLLDQDGSEIQVDASGARYVLLKYSDGLFDLVLEDRNISSLPQSLRHSAAEILLDGEIGEEMRMTRFNAIDVVAKFDDAMQQKGSRIEFLSQQLSDT